MDPRTRLNRPVVGDRVHRARDVVDRVGKRLDAEGARKELIEPHAFYPYAKGARGGTRGSQSRIRIDHYAPQLVRLVRHPYTERGTRMKKLEGTARTREQPVARERYRAELESMLSIDRSVEVLRPTSLHPRLEPRPRPSVAGWLGGQSEELP